MDRPSIVLVICLILVLFLVSAIVACASDRTRTLLQHRNHVELPVALVPEPSNTGPEQTIHFIRNAVLTYLDHRFGPCVRLVQSLAARANSDDLQLPTTPPDAYAGQAGIATDTQATNTSPDHVIAQPASILSHQQEKSIGNHLVPATPLGNHPVPATPLGKSLSFFTTAVTLSGKTVVGNFSRALPAGEFTEAALRLPISMQSIPPVAGQ